MQERLINAAGSARKLFSKTEGRYYSEYPVDPSLLNTIGVGVLVVLIVSYFVYTSWMLKAPV